MHLSDLLHITIITYNRQDYLLSTLESLALTNLSQARITVIDNFSSDNSVDIALSLANRFYSLSVVSNPLNIGAPANVLRAYEYCDSIYHWILADDDVLNPNVVDNLISSLESLEFDLLRISDLGTQGELGSVKTLGDLLHDPHSLSFYSFGFLSGIIHKRINCMHSIQRAYENISSGYPHLFTIFSFFPLDALVYTVPSAVISRSGDSYIGCIIVYYQFLSLRSHLPLSFKRAISWKRKQFSACIFIWFCTSNCC